MQLELQTRLPPNDPPCIILPAQTSLTFPSSRLPTRLLPRPVDHDPLHTHAQLLADPLPVDLPLHPESGISVLFCAFCAEVVGGGAVAVRFELDIGVVGELDGD